MAVFGSFRSLSSPKCIGTILVLFVTLNVIFYKYRLDKKILFLENTTVRDGISGKGQKSLLFSNSLRSSMPTNLTVSPFMNANLSAIKTVLKFEGLDKTVYKAGDIPKLLDKLKAIQERVEKQEAPNVKKMPDCKPKDLGPIKPVETDITKIPDDLSKLYPDVYGGLWRPKDCHPIHKTAVIIPYRNRTTNLKIFLNHMHRFLQKQFLDYGLFVIDQADTKNFNRAKLLNIGYVEALKFHSYDCFILHDIDKLPEDTRNIYTCESKPKHLISQRHTQKDAVKYKPGLLYHWYFGGATSISRGQFFKINGMSNMYWGWGREDDDFAARMTYNWYFGGVSALKRAHFSAINGMSNSYWGWGREDDDLASRVRVRGLGGIFPRGEEGRYLIIDHHDDRIENKMKWPYLNVVKQKMMTDGLNSLNYTIKNVAIEPLYTKISVLL